LKAVNFKIYQGSTTAVTEPVGSGRSSFLKSIVDETATTSEAFRKEWITVTILSKGGEDSAYEKQSCQEPGGISGTREWDVKTLIF
jgi:hypothetical protein